MSWKCKLFGHRWKLETKKVIINKNGGHITLKERNCKRCYLKQNKSILNDIWYDTPLSKEELREIKLNKIKI